MKYYSLDKILDCDALYNIIYGERSNGKTYAVLDYGLQRWTKHHEQMAIVRRWQDDFRGKRAATMFDNHVNNGLIEKYTNGEWTGVYYFAGRWFLSKYDNKHNLVHEDEPFAYAFAISAYEHDKSSSYPNITTIFFDEFLTRGMTLPDEFILFMNVVSTIVRDRDTLKIFMAGNTVNQYSPYFAEMGLTNVKNQQKGTIDVYQYGSSDLKVAVEYSDTPAKKKKSDVYFAFDNPKLEMITGGAWEIDIYPHCPEKFTPKQILFQFYIKFTTDILQCEIVQGQYMQFLYIHRKTTPIKDEEEDEVYSTIDNRPYPNWHRNLFKERDKLSTKIKWFFDNEKVYYQDNLIGEIVRNYRQWCQQ